MNIIKYLPTPILEFLIKICGFFLGWRIEIKHEKEIK